MRIFVFYAHSSIFYVEMKIKFKNYKNLVDLLKGRGCGKAHKYFPLMQANDSQTAWLFGGLNTTVLAFKSDSIKKSHSLNNE